MKMVNSSRSTDKNGFFKRCSAFQFVKRKVRRWIRNPKMNIDKGQNKAFLYPNTKCQMDQDLWYTQLSPYGRCHLEHCIYLQDDPPHGGTEKAKGCKVRKWKMLNRHHGDNQRKVTYREQEIDGGCPWLLRATPVMMECCICSGPFLSYAMEGVWQPRERTQAMDLYSSHVPETIYCGSNDSDYGPNDAHWNIQKFRITSVANAISMFCNSKGRRLPSKFGGEDPSLY